MAAPSANRINARAAKDRKFLKRALANPGLRAKLDPKYLSSSQQASRALNTRLNAPITPGSSTTERDLAHAADAATTVRYDPQERAIGQQIGVAQTTERDTGSFYDEYQRQLAQHAANVQAFQAGAQQALAQTAQGITGLSGAEGAAMQAQANAGAAQQGVAPAGNFMPDANAATAARQALIGSFQGQQAMQGANANTYADTQARVVAPAQKLAARAQAAGRTRDLRKNLTDLKTEEGAFNQSFRDTRRQDEFKNVLAQQTLTGTQTNQAASQEVATTNAQTSANRAKEAARHNRTAEQIAKARNKTAAKTAQQKADLAAGKINQYGYTDAAWRAMSTAQRQKVIKDFKASTAKSKPVEQSTQYRRDFRRKYGIDPLTTQAHNAARDAVSAAQRALKLVGTKDKNGNKITTDQIVQALSSGGTKGIPKTSPVLVRAALDIARYGGVTAATANRLHHAGYSVATLGFKMGKPKPAYKPPPAGTPGAAIPGLGGN